MGQDSTHHEKIMLDTPQKMNYNSYMDIQILDQTHNSIQVALNGNLLASSGCHRTSREVFLFDEFVLKFDSYGDQNENEVAFFTDMLFDEDEQYFPKFLGHGKLNGMSYVMQERINVADDQIPTMEQISLLAELIERYRIEDVGFMGMEYKGYFAGEVYCFNHNVVPVGEDGLKIYDVGCLGDLSDW